jgi:hypothetical protein
MAAGQFKLLWTGDPVLDDVFSFDMTHNEGDFASLDVEVLNPHVGLLSGPVDATLQWDPDGSGFVDVFTGRLVGVPQDMQNEIVKLTFLARPDDYDDQKTALAETLKVAPFWDPIFIDPQRVADPDVVLEARTQHWHIDRVDGTVTVSDILEGEDGVIDLGDSFFYDSLKVSYTNPPLTTVNMKCELSWKQTGSGSVDLSSALEEAFAEAGYAHRGYLSSYTGGGLISTWPKPNANIGGGWKVGESSIRHSDTAPEIGLCAIRATGAAGGFQSNHQAVVEFAIKAPEDGNPENDPFSTDLGIGEDPLGIDDALDHFLGDEKDYSIPEDKVPSVAAGCTSNMFYGQQVALGDGNFLGGAATIGFQMWMMEAVMTVEFTADRARKETVTFSINAGVQPVVSSTDNTTQDLNLSTSQVADPVDPGGLTPIRDARRKSYMLTDRGKQTLEYLIVYSRAHLLARARAVSISFETVLQDVFDLTLRQSVTIADPRLPGGIATGKVTNLTLSLNGDDGKPTAKVTIGCTIGTADTLPSLSSPTDTYATGYSTGYSATFGGGTIIATSDIQYQNYDNTTITDDGIDLINITADQAISVLAVINGVKRQEYLLTNVTYADSGAAMAMLNENCTKVALALKPVTNSNAFETAFPIVVSDLIIPKTLDLEAS